MQTPRRWQWLALLLLCGACEGVVGASSGADAEVTAQSNQAQVTLTTPAGLLDPILVVHGYDSANDPAVTVDGMVRRRQSDFSRAEALNRQHHALTRQSRNQRGERGLETPDLRLQVKPCAVPVPG